MKCNMYTAFNVAAKENSVGAYAPAGTTVSRTAFTEATVVGSCLFLYLFALPDIFHGEPRSSPVVETAS